jgi:phosphoribosylaminoimidazolecarboxamide formyltransferase/IMP cyclohydrolase
VRAIISVSDKTNLIDFVRRLSDLGVTIFSTSTGATRRELEAVGVTVHSVFELTGFPEILDGRVKTLHPTVFGGILARRSSAEHMRQIEEKGIPTIDIVVVNFYPFLQTVAKEGVALEEAIENIDIGGPSLVRAAAKNFADVIVVVDPKDYDLVSEKLAQGGLDLALRRRLAEKAFQHVAIYDTAVAQYLRGEEVFPEEMTLALRKQTDLDHGENRHQSGAFYVEVGAQPSPGLAGLSQLSGKELSFMDFLDLNAALSILNDFDSPTVAIIKHNDSCGLASHSELAEAYRRALSGDPVAAFGGVVAANRTIDLATAKEIYKSYYNVIIAPQYDATALDWLKGKRDLMIVAFEASLLRPSLDFRRVRGGFLAQTPDFITEKEMSPQVVTEREPTEKERQDLDFAWRAVKHLKSNAIAVAKDGTLLGMGAGQPSRVASVEIALKLAGEKAQGGVLASDAFFPFSDGVELAAKGGITAVIQPGGSVKDKEVIETANQYQLAMLFTGVRHFKH